MVLNSIFKYICSFFMVLVSFWHYPDPDPYCLKRIRTQIRPNDTDPYRSGSETMLAYLLLRLGRLHVPSFWNFIHISIFTRVMGLNDIKTRTEIFDTFHKKPGHKCKSRYTNHKNRDSSLLV